MTVPRHKVFTSFHNEDQGYKDYFVEMMGDDIIDESVSDGDIPTDVSTDTIRGRIRDEFIRDATVTIVLIGPCTWQRKHVDWEIGSSLRSTKLNSRCGLLGILLPHHSDYGTRKYTKGLMPPRLADNAGSDDEAYAWIYDWSSTAANVRRWIHRAFERRSGDAPNNGRT
ncbi:MAG: TIR domain-containing protein, partial [Chloroflexi bacterium]|nr:TIR domain-containing protein [Chloroflexota bacterium]